MSLLILLNVTKPEYIRLLAIRRKKGEKGKEKGKDLKGGLILRRFMYLR